MVVSKLWFMLSTVSSTMPCLTNHDLNKPKLGILCDTILYIMYAASVSLYSFRSAVHDFSQTKSIILSECKPICLILDEENFNW